MACREETTGRRGSAFAGRVLRKTASMSQAKGTIAKKALVTIVRFVLLVGLSFVILYPFLAKISSMFMSEKDLMDPMVWFFPKHPTLKNMGVVIQYGHYWEALRNTAVISLCCALLQIASCTLAGYGLGRFRFKGKALVLGIVVLTIVIPPQTIYFSLYTSFRFFDVWKIFSLMGLPTLNLTESLTPMVLLSATAIGLKNGLYILVMMQCFKGIPNELSEAAYVDGAGVYRVFWNIILPQGRSMMLSIFLLSFSWQWTDTFYSGLFFQKTPVLPNVISSMSQVAAAGVEQGTQLAATMTNTAVMMVLLPLVLIYLVMQKRFTQGIESSGLVG